MKLAIMQPYLFPYLGYYQLIAAVDKFVIYDDVNYIKQGWINRNRILLNNKSLLFTVPLKNASSNGLIMDTLIDSEKYVFWKKKFTAVLSQAYKKAANYTEVYSLIEAILHSHHTSIGTLAGESLKSVCNFLNVKTQFVDSSSIYNNHSLKSQERVIDICKKEGAKKYLNLSGGQSLYSKEDFKKQDLQLKFISPKLITYTQLSNEFIPSLSIIDIMMHNSREQTVDMLFSFEIVNP